MMVLYPSVPALEPTTPAKVRRMIRITKQADYGIILLLRLARDPGSLRSATDLAEATALPAPMAGKILKALAREGLLSSKRGAQGGYSLARLPEAISVADIVSALDGPIAITDCLDEACGCERRPDCPTHGHWRWINGAIQTALASVNLADMLAPAPTTWLRPAGIEPMDRLALVEQLARIPGAVDAGPR